MAYRQSSGWWFRGLLIAGMVLALALLTQTVVNYQYVTENLIRQEARRTADERVRGFERALRTARPGSDVDAYQRLLDEYRADVADQVPAIVVLRADGATLAASGIPLAPVTVEQRRSISGSRVAPISSAEFGGNEAFVSILPCRCSPAITTRPEASDRTFMQIAIYRDTLSAPFARLRRNALISASAAIALLLAIGLIAVRVGPYVRGKQLENQLVLARQVQRALLPASTAWPAGVDAAAACVPASQVGGDFYDVRDLPGSQLAFSIGDVSGHGISAALLMSMLHGAMTGRAAGSHDDGPDQIVARLNDLLLHKSTGERFASMIACVYDPQSGRLHYANAGHPPGFLIQHDDDGPSHVSRLAEGGPVLGVLQDAVYQTAAVDVKAGDLLVLFSDGIVEAMNGQDEYFGEGRLLDVIERHRQLPAGAICDEILSAVQAFTGRRPAQDDRSVLVLRLWRAAGERTVAA